jgi:hypothetical protein
MIASRLRSRYAFHPQENLIQRENPLRMALIQASRSGVREFLSGRACAGRSMSRSARARAQRAMFAMQHRTTADYRGDCVLED